MDGFIGWGLAVLVMCLVMSKGRYFAAVLTGADT